MDLDEEDAHDLQANHSMMTAIVVYEIRGDNSLVVMLSTADGKSLLFMGSELLKGSKTAIIISPFVALAEDMRKRCKDAKISSIQWKIG